MDSPLRLITTEAAPAAELAKVVEALLVVASQPLPVEELAAAAEAGVCVGRRGLGRRLAAG